MRGEIFVGRSDPTGHLVELMTDAERGEPSIVLIQGAPGVGKTTLARRVLADRQGFRLVDAAADAYETDVAWGVMDQLARSIGQDVAAELAAMTSIADASAVGGWLLGHLGELESESPVVIMIDDVPWSDGLTMQALLFTLRRLRSERVVVLMTARTNDLGLLPHGLHQLLRGPNGSVVRLDGLGPDEVQELCGALGVRLSPVAAERLVEQTDGNPLHLTALINETDAGSLAVVGDRPLPAPASFRSITLAKLASCAPSTEQLVLAAATLGLRCTPSAAAAVAELTDLGPALDEAVALDLLTEVDTPVGRQLAFTHPMVRSAVYNDVGPARRAALHRLAAAQSSDPWTRLRHLGEATGGVDDDLVAELVEFAGSRVGSGPAGNAAAAAAFRVASEVTGDASSREDLLLRSLECLMAVGDGPAVENLAAVAEQFETSARQLYVIGSLRTMGGDVEPGVEALRRAWEMTDESSDPSLRAGIASQLSIVFLNRGLATEVEFWASQAISSGGLSLLSEPAVSAAMARAGEGRRAEVLDLMPPVPDDGMDLFAIPRALATGVAALWDDDPVTARDELAMAYEASRAFGVFFVATLSLVYLSEAEFRLGLWDDAVHHGELAASTAHDSDQAWFLSLSHGNAALPLAGRGEFAPADEHISEALAAAFMPTYVMWARFAAAFAAYQAGDVDRAAAALAPMEGDPEFDRAVEAVKPWHLLSAEIHAARGELEPAELELAKVRAEIEAHDRPILAVGHWRVRGAIELARGDAAAAEAAFDTAERHAPACPSPFEVALLWLDRGSVLRRANQRRDAAALLESAAAEFRRLGARPMAERAERELASCGLTPAKRSTTTGDELTPAERTVAMLVTRGLRTKEVAAELVVSPKTVEYHLGNIYRKLGVSNRAQLTTRFAELTV